MADPLVNTIRAPNSNSVNMIGNNQYFLRTLKNPQRSRKKSITYPLCLKWIFYIISLVNMIALFKYGRAGFLPLFQLQ